MPATAASAAPITNVMEMVRSTSTPSSAAMVWSCSQARISRPISDALHRPAVERGNRHRYQKHDQEDHGHRSQADRDQDQKRDQRDKAADHENVAMSKIDHADNAIDHGVADGDQAIDRAEHNAVDELLGEIVHALPLFG